MQPPHEHLERGITAHRASFGRGLEVFVEERIDTARLPLQHVKTKQFGRARPVVECDQPESHSSVVTIRTTIERGPFKLSLVFAQASNNFADSVQIVPAVFAKETDPAFEQAIQKTKVPRLIRDTGGFGRCCVLDKPAPNRLEPRLRSSRPSGQGKKQSRFAVR